MRGGGGAEGMKVGGGVGERSKNVKKTMTCVLRVPKFKTTSKKDTKIYFGRYEKKYRQ